MSVVLKPLKPAAIVIHCSDSRGGDAAMINTWHRERFGSGIGYHAVINLQADIQQGRPDNVQGAHCLARGMNAKALGVCLIGLPGEFVSAQLDALEEYCLIKMATYGIALGNIHGHCFYDPANKPYCPGYNVEEWAKGMVTVPTIVSPPPGGWFEFTIKE